jgi:hypothetical protein
MSLKERVAKLEKLIVGFEELRRGALTEAGRLRLGCAIIRRAGPPGTITGDAYDRLLGELSELWPDPLLAAGDGF